MSEAQSIENITSKLAILKAELQKNDDQLFERMSAELFSLLLDGIAVTVAKTGSQFGADGGTAGLRGRHLRIECKRYKDSTRLDPRGLAGEVMEAAGKDPLLETWVLMATKKVTETERNLAFTAGDKLGIPIVVVDWTMPAAGAGICQLAALCATWPEVVERHMGSTAADTARFLTPHVGASVDNLRKDLEFWNIGFRALRATSIKRLQGIWGDSAEARAALNQDAAGGRSGMQLIRRTQPMQQLKDWWIKPENLKSPAVVTGLEGVGKTWITLDWANQNHNDLPIVVVLPASAFQNGYFLSEPGLRELLVRHLREAANSTLSDEFWRARVNNLVQRPSTEGAAILLIVDGANQQPDIQWSSLAETLQGNALAGRVRLLTTVRRTYFETILHRLGRLNPKPTEITVGPFDDIELDELLHRHGMKRSEIHPGLTKLASVPRLFPLVHRLKDNIALQSEASIPRLLFEYGRDVMQQRQPSSLTEDNWVAWLVERAKHYHQKIEQTKRIAQPETYSDVAKSLDSPDLSSEEVARRLSDVLDGGLFQKTTGGITTKLVLQEDAAILGLGLALLDILSDNQSGSFDEIQAELEKWLEPVAAIDQVTQVLRAALAVSSATQGVDGQAIIDSLLVTWMNAQNPTISYQQDVKVFGDAFPRSMLTVVELSTSGAARGVQFSAIQCLRNLPRIRSDDWQVITERMMEWASCVQLPSQEQVLDPTHYAKRHQEQLIKRIGTVKQGIKIILGAPLKLSYQHFADVAAVIPSILEGHDLTAFASVFQRAAICEAVRVEGYSRCWPGLGWLVLLGGADEVKMRECLQKLAEDILLLEPEPGVHTRLRNSAAAMLMRLTADEQLETQARVIDERFGGGWDYAKDYLENPGNSFFVLERRHLKDVLEDEGLPMARQLEKLKPFLADTSITLPSNICDILEELLKEESFNGIDGGGQFTAEQHRFEELEPLAARFLPVTHAETARRRLHALAARNGEQKYWSALHAPQLLLIAGPEESDAIAGMRIRTKLDSYEHLANTWCLELELLHKPLEEQLMVLANADNYFFPVDLIAVMRDATARQLIQFFETNTANAIRVVRIIFEIMAYQITSNADTLAEKLVNYLICEDDELRAIAFVALSSCAPEVCGRKLLAINWKPDVTEPLSAHYGSLSIAKASQHLSFDEVLPMIAPWRWLDAAAARGNNSVEFRLASRNLLSLIKNPSVELQELNAVVSMRVPNVGELARLSVSERPDPNEDHLDGLRKMTQDLDEINRRMQDFAKEAAATIQKIRSNGYALYLHAFTKESIQLAYQAARLEWEDILQGSDTLESAFVERVRSAEGLYTSLCEVLLETDPSKGAVLWRALRSCIRTQVKGKAGIPELIHMVFRTPDSAEVAALREELASLENTSNDKAILDLVIAAQVNDKDTWLEELVRVDKASLHLWRRKRAILLDAFRQYPGIEQIEWPEGEKIGSWQTLKEQMVAWTNRGVFARHWWDKFLTASTADEAFCAWTIFLSCADRRSHIWIQSMEHKVSSGSELDRLRQLHVQLNRDLFERKCLEQEKKSPSLSDKLFRRDAPGEWLQFERIKS